MEEKKEGSMRGHHRFVTFFPDNGIACIRAAETTVSLAIFQERLRTFTIAYSPEIEQLLNLTDGSRERERSTQE